MNSSEILIDPSSFRDPSGFIFYHDGQIFRQIDKNYSQEYEHLKNSGLVRELINKNLLINFKEVKLSEILIPNTYKIISPQYIEFITYPYEWCFNQLKDAALLTLEVQNIALKYNMTLKDCSAYNVQFYQGKPIFIDSLSFNFYNEGQPWIGYRQFCEHFLGPLLLGHYKKYNIAQLSKTYIDGIPLSTITKLLPKKTFFSFSILSHIHLHAYFQTNFKFNGKKNYSVKTINQTSFIAIIENLKKLIQGLKYNGSKSYWKDYYHNNNYTNGGISHKKKIISKMLNMIDVTSAWDIGCNTGFFSYLLSKKLDYVVSMDNDYAVIERLYSNCKKNEIKNIYPIHADIINPSPGVGWENEERKPLLNRGPKDLTMALALIHHLRIANNTPFQKIANLFQKIGQFLIIEFIPKNDSQVERLLATRVDIYSDYTQENFEKTFSYFFKILKKEKIENSLRYIYLMQSL